jgi:hypothetical protein
MNSRTQRPYYPTSGFTNATERTRAFKGWGIGTDPGRTEYVIQVLGLPYGFQQARTPVHTVTDPYP